MPPLISTSHENPQFLFVKVIHILSCPFLISVGWLNTILLNNLLTINTTVYGKYYLVQNVSDKGTARVWICLAKRNKLLNHIKIIKVTPYLVG